SFIFFSLRAPTQLYTLSLHDALPIYEDILAPDTLFDAHPDLAISESEDAHLRHRHVEPGGDLLRQGRVALAAEQLQAWPLGGITRDRSLRLDQRCPLHGRHGLNAGALL